MPDFKTRFNNYIRQNIAPSEIDEVALFRALMNIYSKSSNVVTALEIHGRHNSVEFYSTMSMSNNRKELGDLLLICHDKDNKVLRICTMQNKYRRNKLPKAGFSCPRMDAGQWDLLKMRYSLIATQGISFPSNILNFRSDYLSISAYGIFYKDPLGDFDFFYTVPDYLYPVSTLPFPMPKSLKRTFRFIFHGNSSYFHPGLVGSSANETVFGCNFNLFDASLQSFQIGAPLGGPDGGVSAWVLGALQYLSNVGRSNAVGSPSHTVSGDLGIIERAVATLRTNLEANSDYGEDAYRKRFNAENLPNVLLVEVASEIGEAELICA